MQGNLYTSIYSNEMLTFLLLSPAFTFTWHFSYIHVGNMAVGRANVLTTNTLKLRKNEKMGKPVMNYSGWKNYDTFMLQGILDALPNNFASFEAAHG